MAGSGPGATLEARDGPGTVNCYDVERLGTAAFGQARALGGPGQELPHGALHRPGVRMLADMDMDGGELALDLPGDIHEMVFPLLGSGKKPQPR